MRENAAMRPTTPAIPADVLETFDRLFAEAAAAGEPDPTAMTVASADAQGRPSARTVLLKAHDARGFVFYTHLDGRKGRELQANPQAALLFHWPRVREGVQVRIEGAVEIVDAAEADAYFAMRPRGSQVGAWASMQSQVLDARATFESRVAEVEARFEGQPVPRPPRWSGFRIVPRAIEFWYGAQFRLHERQLHERLADGSWSTSMLYP
jgi:pyridoxamine 5'-phosphate oxidase